MKQYQDTDYLHASARVRALETKMLGKRDLQKMIDCHNFEEAFKVLNDAGIAVGCEPGDYETGLSRSLEEAYRLVENVAPHRELFSIFRCRYDGHNLKTLIKGRRASGDYRHILTALGNVAPERLENELESGRFEQLDPALAKAAEEASEALAKTGDPQAVDIIIDRGVLTAMHRRAAEYDCPFMSDYVAAYIDIANIRSTVRVKRMDKDVFFLRRVLTEGGRLETGRLTDAFAKGMDEILAVVGASVCGKALEPSFESLRAGGTLTRFEHACDDYIAGLISRAKMVAFGVEPVIAFLFAKENEIKQARIVLASKAAGVAPAQITERLQNVLS